MIETGEKQPHFRPSAQHGAAKALKYLAAKKGLVLFAYPMTNTCGPTAEAE